jgi:hypothetical protein
MMLTLAYVHFASDDRACQKAQYAVAGGVTAHASCAGLGSPSMRQRNASPYWAVPAVVNPAEWSAVRASAGCPGAQPRSILPPGKWVKSTITVTPAVTLHAGAAPAAPPTAGAPTAIPRIAIAAPMIVFMTGSSPRVDQHGVRGTIVDAVELATGSVLLIIAGTAWTVANVLGLVLGGKKNAP